MTFLFLSLSLRRWGNPSPVWVFPCVLFLLMDADYVFDPDSVILTFTKVVPSPCFFFLVFFFFSSSLAGMVVVGCGVSVSVCLGGFLVLLALLHCMQDVS